MRESVAYHEFVVQRAVHKNVRERATVFVIRTGHCVRFDAHPLVLEQLVPFGRSFATETLHRFAWVDDLGCVHTDKAQACRLAVHIDVYRVTVDNFLYEVGVRGRC